MLLISFTPANELAVSGNVLDLQAVCAELLALAEGRKTHFVVAADTKPDPAPYQHALNALRGRVTTGPTKVSVVGKSVEVEGSRESFGVFASYFSFDVDAGAGMHNHHEYYDGNPYVHPQSVPLIVGVR